MADAWGGAWGSAWGSSWGSGASQVLGGINTRLWTRYFRDETEEEKNLRRIASGILPKPAEKALEKAAFLISEDEDADELEEEFVAALSARVESLQLRKQLWAYELQRIREEQEDEEISILLLTS